MSKPVVIIDNRKFYNRGLSLGSAIAVAISWTLNGSVWWSILHGILGWAYVLYYGLGYAS